MEKEQWNTTRSNLRKRAVKRVNQFFDSLNDEHELEVDTEEECSFHDDCTSEAIADSLPNSDIDSGDGGLSGGDDDRNDVDDARDLASCLRDWSRQFGISLIALSALLFILKVHHPSLPKDARTLLKTQISHAVSSLAGGSFHYFGIQNMFKDEDHHIQPSPFCETSVSMAMFYIVEFYETQEVEVVPAAWVADDVCQWPTYYKPDELAKAIKNEEQPGDSWEEYRVRILYKAASYKAARLKLPEAETHTDLQTAEEDDDMPRRKRKRKLLTNQEMIMDQLKIVTLTLQKIQGEHVGGQEVLEADLFPLKDISSLLAVERRVREEADYKKKMITALSVIGGVDIKDTVWRIMKHLFTNSLAKQLNWRGVNGKTAFHSLQLKDIITGECYPQTHGAAARVTLAALGVYRLQKSGASDIGYLALQLCVFRGAPSDPQARLLD
ncbi:hypothetical protein ABVT39_010736 [Epinephelus coioides]